MYVPGASNFSSGLRFVNVASRSVLVLAPTATALEMHAGALIVLFDPLFPDAITVAMPTLRSRSMAVLYAGNSASQLPV